MRKKNYQIGSPEGIQIEISEKKTIKRKVFDPNLFCSGLSACAHTSTSNLGELERVDRLHTKEAFAHSSLLGRGATLSESTGGRTGKLSKNICAKQDFFETWIIKNGRF